VAQLNQIVVNVQIAAIVAGEILLSTTLESSTERCLGFGSGFAPGGVGGTQLQTGETITFEVTGFSTIREECPLPFTIESILLDCTDGQGLREQATCGDPVSVPWVLNVIP